MHFYFNILFCTAVCLDSIVIECDFYLSVVFNKPIMILRLPNTTVVQLVEATTTADFYSQCQNVVKTSNIPVYRVILQSETRVVNLFHYNWPDGAVEQLPTAKDILEFISDVQSENPTRPVVIQCL